MIQRTAAKGKAEPLWWARNVLGENLWKAQQDILESVCKHSETAVKSGHGTGKSYIAARAALWFLFNHPSSIVLTTAPTDRQVRGILWKEIAVAYHGSKIPLGGNLLTQELHVSPGWFAMGFTAPDYDPDKFQGFHARNILVIIDEAAGLSPQIYESIDSVLSSENAKKLEIGNPTNPIGQFASSFKTPGIKKFSISAYDTPNFTTFGITEEHIAQSTWRELIGESPLPYPDLVTPEWVEKRFKRWGPTSSLYQARVLAQFPTAGSDTLIPLHLIEAAQNRTLKPTEPHLLGVDVARYGDDSTIIYRRQGCVARRLAKMPKSSTMDTAGKIAYELQNSGAKSANVDVIGMGAGVVDRLRELGLPVTEANASAKPINPEKYGNARAEWFWTLRERFEAGDIDIDTEDENLAEELSSIRWKLLSNGKIQIEPKEETKKRLGRSPDDADALAMAFMPQFTASMFSIV